VKIVEEKPKEEEEKKAVEPFIKLLKINNL